MVIDVAVADGDLPFGIEKEAIDVFAIFVLLDFWKEGVYGLARGELINQWTPLSEVLPFLFGEIEGEIDVVRGPVVDRIGNVLGLFTIVAYHDT